MGSIYRENRNIFQITCQSIIRHVEIFQKDILLRGYKYALLVSERNYKKPPSSYVVYKNKLKIKNLIFLNLRQTEKI